MSCYVCLLFNVRNLCHYSSSKPLPTEGILQAEDWRVNRTLTRRIKRKTLNYYYKMDKNKEIQWKKQWAGKVLGSIFSKTKRDTSIEHPRTAALKRPLHQPLHNHICNTLKTCIILCREVKTEGEEDMKSPDQNQKNLTNYIRGWCVSFSDF